MEYLTYKKFYEKEGVEALTQILKENRIVFEVIEDKDNLDSLYGGNHFNVQYFIKIKKEDFSKVDSALAKKSEMELETVDRGHYLFGFTDEELFDVISKPDEWNEFDYQLSKNILKDRGKEISHETEELLKKKRLNELAKPEESQKTWIYGGYIFAMLGGVIGAFIGWHLSTSKKTLPNGSQVYSYLPNDRKHGRIILVIGIIMATISLALRFSQ